MTSVVYLSYPISEDTPLYGNGTGIELNPDKQMHMGDSCNTMMWRFPNHAGTHVDAPRHFSSTGKSISDYQADFWIFNRIELVDISEVVEDCQLIEPELFPDFKIEDPDLLLIRTGYSHFRGTERYTLTPPGISANSAHWLRNNFPSVRCVGMDLISISSYNSRKEGRKAHQTFLSPKKGNPILLVEDMDLDFRGQLQQVIILPMQVTDSDASPCVSLGIIS